jgi:hypothetical protein
MSLALLRGLHKIAGLCYRIIYCPSNIDVRIQQAELEYQLGREELNLLTLLEESRNLQICLEDAEQNRTKTGASTIYRYDHGLNPTAEVKKKNVLKGISHYMTYFCWFRLTDPTNTFLEK